MIADATVQMQARAAPAMHVCASSDDMRWRHRRCVAFMLRGLARREQVIYVDAPPNRTSVLRLLRDHRRGTERDLASGRLQVLDIGDLYLSGGTFDAERVCYELLRVRDQALADGYAAARVVGTGDWVTSTEPGWDRWTAYEQLVNDAFTDATLSAMCVYDRSSVPPEAAERLASAHPLVETSPDAPGTPVTSTWLGLAGEIDFTTAGHLHRLLADQLLDDDLHVDLGRLEFIDVAGLRTLATAARGLPSGRRLVLHNPRPLVRKALAALDWHDVASMPVIIDEPAGSG